MYLCHTHTHVYNIGGGALYISNVRLACNKMGNCAGVSVACIIEQRSSSSFEGFYYSGWQFWLTWWLDGIGSSGHPGNNWDGSCLPTSSSSSGCWPPASNIQERHNNNLIRGKKTSGESNTIRLHHFPSASPKSLLIVYTSSTREYQKETSWGRHPHNFSWRRRETPKVLLLLLSFLLCYDVVKYIYIFSQTWKGGGDNRPKQNRKRPCPLLCRTYVGGGL